MALAGAALMTGGPAFAGPLVPNKNLDITFDGFCDGLHLAINHTTGTVKGNFTGCVAGDAAGVVGGFAKEGASVAVFGVQSGGSTALMYIVDDNPKRWSILLADGSILNSGTWSVGVPLAGVGSDVRPSGASK